MSGLRRLLTVVAASLALAPRARAEEAPAEPPKRPVLSWKDGKTTIETDKFVINLTNRLQFRFMEEFPASGLQLPGTPAPGDPRGSFRIPRARFKVDGWAYTKRLEYELQLDWVDSVSTLRDLAVNVDLLGGRRLMLKAGQFKVPFGRQELTSSSMLQFVDRSIVSAEYERGRDVGVQAWGLLAGQRLEYRLGVFNGGGRQRNLGASLLVGNDNDKYQYDARVIFQPWGDVKYSESDFESKGKPLLAVALNVEKNDTRLPPPVGTGDFFARTVLGGDVSFKYRGLSFLGEYFDRTRKPASGPDIDGRGWHVQAGYLFDHARTWEVAFRYATSDPDRSKDSDDRSEIGGALSYYRMKHNLKVQADFRRLEGQTRDVRLHELRLQGTIAF